MIENDSEVSHNPKIDVQSTEISRRTFLSWIGLGWLGLGATLALMAGAFGRFLFPNVVQTQLNRFKVGFPKDFPHDTIDSRFKKDYGIWIVRGYDSATAQNGFYVLAAVCTHLGCTPNWLSSEGKFRCPCHGSGFYRSGINFEGPAPRPLERYGIVLDSDGQIVVDKSRTFRQEKGEWKNPAAFLKHSG